MPTTLTAHTLVANTTAGPQESQQAELGGLAELWTKLVTAETMVSNTGARTGLAVPQLYLSFPETSVPEGNPLRVLCGFEKISLEPGESKIRLAASFFLSRGGGDVSYAGKFVASIAVQLAQNVSASREHICTAVAECSDVASQSLGDPYSFLKVNKSTFVVTFSPNVPVRQIVVDIIFEDNGPAAMFCGPIKVDGTVYEDDNEISPGHYVSGYKTDPSSPIVWAYKERCI
ncbi:hypothetical protein DM02DRAFT_654911 [Periconia macrospinosa]|uniref:Fibronectin type III-like domain-containing protein n=1 Tax=Periconia macrospinosa TaxID=97972 RepID=A0A2V1DSD1_9PLEO|nr:hypothetical protein DM02DRAFT_654911 [Periconia macrospinosa]